MTRFAKFKQRFKRALFAFFKEEILEAVGYTGPRIPDVVVRNSRLDFQQITAEIKLTSGYEYGRSELPAHLIYERSLEEARKALFEESMKFVHIDERSVLDRGIYDARAIRVSLFVAKKP